MYFFFVLRNNRKLEFENKIGYFILFQLCMSVIMVNTWYTHRNINNEVTSNATTYKQQVISHRNISTIATSNTLLPVWMFRNFFNF